MWRSSFSEDIAWSENLQFYSHPDHFHFCKENNKKKKDPGFNSLYTTAAHEPGARLRRMQVSGRDEDGQACSFSPAHTFLSISHTRSTQVGAWRAWYTLLLRKRRTNQTKMFYQRQAPKMQDLILVELLKWPVEGQINYSMGLPTVTMLWGPLRSGTSLQGLSSPGPLCSSQGLSALGPLCSRASALALSLLYLAAPICPSPSLVPLTKWTQSLPPLLADEKVRSYLLRTKLGVVLKAIPSSWDTDFWWGITVYKNEFTQVDNVRTDLFQASFVNQRAGTRELEEVD